MLRLPEDNWQTLPHEFRRIFDETMFDNAIIEASAVGLTSIELFCGDMRSANLSWSNKLCKVSVNICEADIDVNHGLPDTITIYSGSNACEFNLSELMNCAPTFKDLLYHWLS